MMWLRYFFLLCFLLYFPVIKAQTVTDDISHTVILSHPPKRIISLAPDLTELLFAAGAGQYIVGVMKGSDYPSAAKKIPVIANYNALNIEAILALHPDLIVAWKQNSYASQLRLLQRFNIPVYFSDQHDLSDIPNTLQRLGVLSGTEKIANHAAEKFHIRYVELQKKYAHHKPISVFYQLWSHPLMTVNKTSWINQIITLCGGKNIFADVKNPTPQINLEAVIVANPDIILSSDSSPGWKIRWQQWSQMTAVRQKHLFTVEPDLLERAGPRLLEGADRVCQFLQAAR